ncbi:MAG: hypothetical protein R2941_03425 [Desulfobacterales bacterium]
MKLIGPLQKNKINKALRIFAWCRRFILWDLLMALTTPGSIGKRLSVLIEINSGGESAKSGVLHRNTMQ